MPWFNVDDGFANSKPVLRIPRRYRCPAVGLWTLAGSWSAKELTDGFIPDHALEEFCSTSAMADLLVHAGLWKRVDRGWQFENWSKYQKTKAQVCAYRAAEAERKQRQRSGGKPAGQASVSASCPGGTPPGVPPVSQRASGHPLPKPLPVPKESVDGPRVEAVGHTLSEFCTKHPNGTLDRCGDCANARKVFEARKRQLQALEQDELNTKRLQREHDKRMQRECPVCDENGMRETPTGLTRCNHQEAANA